MPVVAATFARSFAEEWIAAWNAHDVERVLSHYTEDVEFASPFAITMANVPSGVVHGKPALRAYWMKALTLVPDLHFTLVDVLTGIDTITLVYRGHRGMVAEVFRLDGDQRVRAATACYALAG